MVYPRGNRLLESPRDARNMQWIPSLRLRQRVSNEHKITVFCNIAEDLTKRTRPNTAELPWQRQNCREHSVARITRITVAYWAKLQYFRLLSILLSVLPEVERSLLILRLLESSLTDRTTSNWAEDKKIGNSASRVQSTAAPRVSDWKRDLTYQAHQRAALVRLTSTRQEG